MDRFWSKVNKSTDCWLWTAATRGNGYGCFKYHGKVIDSHRMAYILTYGEIPDGKLVCHSCDNRLCVNPKHLWLGTYYDNNMDARNKGRLYPIENAKKARGEKIGCSKLTPEKVLSIREEYGTYDPTWKHMGYRRLARKYNVGRKTIQSIIRRETWIHV